MHFLDARVQCSTLGGSEITCPVLGHCAVREIEMTRAELMRQRICIGSKQKPRDIAPGAKSSPRKNNYAFKGAAFFLRQPSRTNPIKPVAKSGRAPGMGIADTFAVI